MNIRPVLTCLTLLVAGLILGTNSRAGLSLVEEGGGIRQMTSDESYLYLLRESGQVLRRSLRGGPLEILDESSENRMIAATRGVLYLLENSGGLHRFQYGSWQALETFPQARMITASSGQLFLLEESGKIWSFDGQSFGDQPIEDQPGIQTVVASGRDLWFLTLDGEVYRRRGASLDHISSEIGPVRQLSAGPGACYLLEEDGRLWKYQHGQLTLLPQGHGALQLSQGGEDLFVMQANGELWSYQDFFARWTQVEASAFLRTIHAASEALFLLEEDGKLWSWTRQPWGADSVRSRNFQALYAAD